MPSMFIFFIVFIIIFVHDCVQGDWKLWFSWVDWPLWPILLRNALGCKPITVSFPNLDGFIMDYLDPLPFSFALLALCFLT